MTVRLQSLIGSRSGNTGFEFALLLPLLMLLLLGFIDAARFIWSVNRAEKATHMGVRYAVTTDMVASGLSSYPFTQSGIGQGQPIPTDAFVGVTCNSTDCTNKGAGPVPGYSSTAFNSIVARMQAFMPEIQPANVIVEYDNSGLGYAGDPNAPDVAALTTVHLTGLSFQPMTFFAFGGSIPMPSFRSALTMEDGEGTVAN